MQMEKNRINRFDMNYKEAISVMSDGNPGAINVMCMLINHDPVKGQVALCHLDDMGIYGSQIWIAYKDICGQDIELLMKKIYERKLTISTP